MFFGDDCDDAVHLEFFPKDRKNLDLFLVQDGGHSVASCLKDNGILYPAIRACRTGGEVGLLLIEAQINFVTGEDITARAGL